MLETSNKPVLAVDLGGTKIIAAVVLPDGKIVSRKYCLTLAKDGFKAVTERLLAAATEAIIQSKVDIMDLSAVCIAAAGIINVKRGIITYSPNLPGWRNVALRDIVSEKLGLDTYIINDASAAALGEHRFGAGKGVDNLIYITVSTGIGGGIIIDGKLYTGSDGCAGEIGHMIVDVNGPKCSCGNSGCLEAMASGTAVAREAVIRINQGECSSIIELAGGKIENVTAEKVALAARKGDKVAWDIISKAANYLGTGFVNLVNVFNPDLIIVGGGMSKMGNMLLNPARKIVKQRSFKLPARRVHIVRSGLGSNAGIIGAAVYAIEQQLKKGGSV